MADKRIKERRIKLIVAGEFYDNKKQYTDMISNLRIRDHVIIKSDFIPAENVKNYFCAADLITQTYHTATQSGITQIAYSFERPMLVTNVGGLAEIVPHNKVGYVCEPCSADVADCLAGLQ